VTTIFIAGSMNIKNLDRKIRERIDKIVDSGYSVVVGDADGADTSIQDYLHLKCADQVTVYCSGESARNNVGNWPLANVVTKAAPGTRAFFTAKDVEMANVADYGLMIWDTKSTGTLSNVLELLSRKKKSYVFVNKDKVFKAVGDVDQLAELVKCMSDHARNKADEKIRLMERIGALRQETMFA
jgi:hypothetical protein